MLSSPLLLSKNNQSDIELSQPSTLKAADGLEIATILTLLNAGIASGQKKLQQTRQNNSRVRTTLFLLALATCGLTVWQTVFVPEENKAAGLTQYNNDINPSFNDTCQSAYPVNTTNQFCQLQELNETIISACQELGAQICDGNMNLWLVGLLGGVSMFSMLIWAALKSAEEPQEVKLVMNSTSTPFTSLSSQQQTQVKQAALHHKIFIFTGPDATLEQVLSAFEKLNNKSSPHNHFNSNRVINGTNTDSDEERVVFHNNI